MFTVECFTNYWPEICSAMRDGHKRRIQTTLTLLDRATCDFCHWADGHEQHSVLHEAHNSLDRDQCQQIKRYVSEIRAELQQLKLELQLKISHQDAATMIRARCATLSEALVELTPGRMKRYGALSDDDAQTIQQAAGKLIELVEAIARCTSADGRKSH